MNIGESKRFTQVIKIQQRGPLKTTMNYSALQIR